MTSLSDPAGTSVLPMSRRERCAWVQLVTTLGVYAPYFACVAVQMQRGTLSILAMTGMLFGAVVLQTVLMVVASVVFVAPARREPKDEHDHALEGRSLRAAYRVLASLGLTLLVLAPVCGGLALVRHVSTLMMLMLAGQGFLLCFVLAEAVRFGVLARGYRRGF